MLNLKDITKIYDEKVVLEKVNIGFNKGDVVGFIGPNGTGKSTLLQIAAGVLYPDEGVVTSHEETIAYLPQYPEFGDLTVADFLTSKLESSIESYKIDIALEQTGLSHLEKNQKCTDLSGGERTKLCIASFLLIDPVPTVLILDEPTNNLDLDGLEWLENYILSHKGIVLLTSHDRFFLDKVVTKIVEIDKGKLKTYGGNYTFYKDQKRIEQEALERMYVVQQKKIKRATEDIFDYKNRALQGELKYTSRNPYEKKKAAKAAKVAVVRQKKLENFLESADFIEKSTRQKRYGVTLSGSVNSGKLIVECVNCSKSFTGTKILNNVSFSIHGNDRVWIVGKNGSGKSTLIKIIIGAITQDEGIVRLGSTIKYGYFSQESLIDPESTGVNELKSTGADSTTCYTTAAHLHLFEDDLRKKVAQLSRGQVAKLEFVKLLVANNDLLILDEPTNHLEIETREDIENALIDYKGALLIATHDRYFIDTLGITHTLDL